MNHQQQEAQGGLGTLAAPPPVGSRCGAVLRRQLLRCWSGEPAGASQRQMCMRRGLCASNRKQRCCSAVAAASHHSAAAAGSVVAGSAAVQLAYGSRREGETSELRGARALHGGSLHAPSPCLPVTTSCSQLPTCLPTCLPACLPAHAPTQHRSCAPTPPTRVLDGLQRRHHRRGVGAQRRLPLPAGADEVGQRGGQAGGHRRAVAVGHLLGRRQGDGVWWGVERGRVVPPLLPRSPTSAFLRQLRPCAAPRLPARSAVPSGERSAACARPGRLACSPCGRTRAGTPPRC